MLAVKGKLLKGARSYGLLIALLVTSSLGLAPLAAQTTTEQASVSAAALSGASPQVVAVAWYSWDYYASFSSCMAAGASLQASNPVFVDHRCTPGTSPYSGKYQLWMAERA